MSKKKQICTCTAEYVSGQCAVHKHPHLENEVQEFLDARIRGYESRFPGTTISIQRTHTSDSDPSSPLLWLAEIQTHNDSAHGTGETLDDALGEMAADWELSQV